MSFFLDEPPPLDYEIPPPLDDKIRDNDFDLEDEIIIEDNISTTNLELPDLPSDYNVYSSTSIEDPPEIPSIHNSIRSLSSSSERIDEKEIETHSDVAQKKESDTKSYDDDSTDVDVIVRVESDVDVVVVVEKKIESSSTVECDDEIGERTEPEGSSEVNELTVTKVEDRNENFKSNNEWDEVKNRKESAGDSKTENSEDDFDDFTEFQATHTDIPEPVPELNFENSNEDEDDDFNDFESAIPSNRQIELVQKFDEKVTISEVAFEADFSGFNAFSNETKDDFDDFQDFSSAQPEIKTVQNSINQLAQNIDDDDDDDFGEFSDFKAAEAPTNIDYYPTHSKFLMKPNNVSETFNMMFPNEGDVEEVSHETVKDELNVLKFKSDNFVSKFNDFDETIALGYQYNNSKASQTLVKSLGIDTRNILAQWNNSSSNVPRFAANLSFSPIEPIKPTDGGQKSASEPNPTSATSTTSTVLQPSKVDSVPEADFDWNTSGLVNPLDAHKSNYLLDLEQLRVAMANSDKINSSSSLNHAPSSNDPTSQTNQMTDIDELLRQFDSLNTCPTSNFTTLSSANSTSSKKPSVLQEESLQPSSYPFEDESTNSVVDKEVKQTFETETKTHASNKSELSEPFNYQWSNNSNLVRTIKLPETHIFTPIKGTSPVSREVVSRDRDLSPPLPTDDPLPSSTKNTVPFVKEYRDVEYSLEPIKKTSTIDLDAEFDDFQSAETVVQPPIIPIADLPALVPDILAPVKAPEKKSETIKWPEPGVISNPLDDDFSFLEIETKVVNSTIDDKVTNITAFKSSNPSILSNSQKIESFVSGVETKATVNGSVSCVDDDADFDDFQSAEPIPSKVVEVMKPQDPITLSPAHLVAQTAQQPSTWISSFDDAEISRIEAAFPKCKVNKSTSQTQSNDDDNDWSDFVTATPQNPSKQMANGDSDDWSDFVSMPPVTKISSPAKNSISSQVQSKPNFTSWNQPVRNQYVNHTTSFLTNDTKLNASTAYQYPSYITDNVPRPSITITDNFNYFQSQNQNFQQPKRSNGVSTILPELDFVMAKQNVVNFSRGGPLDPGKK